MAYDPRLAADDFRRFASEHGLSYAEGGAIPRATFALMRESSTSNIVAGELPGSLNGFVADFAYEVREGDEKVSHHTLVLLTRVPETIGFIPRLFCQDASRHTLVDRTVGLLNVFRTTELESLSFNARYRVGVDRDQDEVWVRQLFDPVFIDWLADRAPEGCFFELMEGVLCVSSAEMAGAPGAVDRLCAFAATVAERLRSEVDEHEGLPIAPRANTERTARGQARLDRAVAQVHFESPPADVRSAAKRFRPVARRRPSPWIFALGLSAIVLLLPVGFFVVFLVAAFHLKGGPALALGGALLLAGVLVLMPISIRSFVRSSSITWAFDAFLRGYATSRSLTTVDARLYHASHPRLRLPGVAQRVLSGPLPGGAGDGTLVIGRDPAGRRTQLTASRAAVLHAAPFARLPVVSVSPRASHDGSAVLGGFLLRDVHGLTRPPTPPPAAAGDPTGRLRERFDVVVDEAADPAALRALLSPDLVDWLTTRAAGAELGFTLEGGDLVLFTQETPIIDWTATDLDRFCADLAYVRDKALSLGAAG